MTMIRLNRAIWFGFLAIVPFALISCNMSNEAPQELSHIHKTTMLIKTFEPNPKFDRHDPSNIIQYENRYWVYYTRNIGNHKEVSIWVASSIDGYNWNDLGQSLPCGPRGSWDESGTIAPYIVIHKKMFYLFYTGFCQGDLSTRQLGCAISDKPEGPWKRWPGNPILRQDPDPSVWDSGMLGDSNVLFREGKWWLYYKSRRHEETAKETRIGVAIADEITGPYKKFLQILFSRDMLFLLGSIEKEWQPYVV